MRLFKWCICMALAIFFLLVPSSNYTGDTGFVVFNIWMLGSLFYMGEKS